MEEKFLLSALEASKKLGICEKTLFTYSKSGEIPSLKIGRRRMYDPQDIIRWIESKKKLIDPVSTN